MKTTQDIAEYTTHARALTVDREKGIIRRVKVVGLSSQNGRRYTTQALRGAREQYEGAKVNVNHTNPPRPGPRRYEERLGNLRDVYVAEDGLYADLIYNPKHPIAEQLAWDAEHAPQNVGLSHLARTTGRHDGREWIVESIDQVHAIDLVADPATTTTLFESHAATNDTTPPRPPIAETIEQRLDAIEKQLAELAATESTHEHASATPRQHTHARQPIARDQYQPPRPKTTKEWAAEISD